MHIWKKLVLSGVMAFIVLGALTCANLLQFGNLSKNEQPGSAAQHKVHEKKPGGSLPGNSTGTPGQILETALADGGTAQLSEHKPARPTDTTEGITVRTASDTASDNGNPALVLPMDEEIIRRCVSYLYFLAGSDARDVERRFRLFLQTEFTLSSVEEDRLLQMAFWKNFLVLQQGIVTDAVESLKPAFERELALKRAGSRALGIELVNFEIESARTLLGKTMDGAEANAHSPGENAGEYAERAP